MSSNIYIYDFFLHPWLALCLSSLILIHAVFLLPRFSPFFVLCLRVLLSSMASRQLLACTGFFTGCEKVKTCRFVHDGGCARKEEASNRGDDRASAACGCGEEEEVGWDHRTSVSMSEPQCYCCCPPCESWPPPAAPCVSSSSSSSSSAVSSVRYQIPRCSTYCRIQCLPLASTLISDFGSFIYCGCLSWIRGLLHRI